MVVWIVVAALLGELGIALRVGEQKRHDSRKNARLLFVVVVAFRFAQELFQSEKGMREFCNVLCEDPFMERFWILSLWPISVAYFGPKCRLFESYYCTVYSYVSRFRDTHSSLF